MGKKTELLKLVIFIVVAIGVIGWMMYGYIKILGFNPNSLTSGFGLGVVSSLFVYAIIKQIRKVRCVL